MTREVRSAAELTVMLMAEIRKHPECDEIEGVTIFEPVQKRWGANWDANFVHGKAPTCAKAQEIVRRFQEIYDLG